MRYTGPSADVLELVKARNGGACLRCSRRAGEQCHHRIPRGMGGTKDPKINEPPNLVWICADCHREIESRRADAIADGWLLHRSLDPAAIYLITPDLLMIMLDRDGGMITDSSILFPDYPTPF